FFDLFERGDCAIDGTGILATHCRLVGLGLGEDGLGDAAAVDVSGVLLSLGLGLLSQERNTQERRGKDTVPHSYRVRSNTGDGNEAKTLGQKAKRSANWFCRFDRWVAVIVPAPPTPAVDAGRLNCG